MKANRLDRRISVRTGYRQTTGVLVLTIIGLLVVGPGEVAAVPGPPPVRVAASFFPLAHFAERVGKGLATVTSVMPPGTEPHGWEPTPSALRGVWDADVFLHHGAGIDPWAERIRADVAARGVATLRMMDHFPGEGLSAGDTHNHGHGDDSSGGGTDPHIWLDPVLAMREVDLIRDILVLADPTKGNAFRANGATYRAELARLDESFRRGLADCRLKDIVVTHNAFDFLARRYGFTAHAILDGAPEREPSPKSVGRLVSLAREKGIRHIFFETLGGSRLARTIARETGAGVLPLNPLGSLTPEQVADGATYISEMGANLKNLREALACD